MSFAMKEEISYSDPMTPWSHAMDFSVEGRNTCMGAMIHVAMLSPLAYRL
jgi:hypothetical protein